MLLELDSFSLPPRSLYNLKKRVASEPFACMGAGGATWHLRESLTVPEASGERLAQRTPKVWAASEEHRDGVRDLWLGNEGVNAAQ